MTWDWIAILVFGALAAYAALKGGAEGRNRHAERVSVQDVART
jgi:hypothetical protein